MDDSVRAEIAAFVVERDEMLLALDLDRMKAFHAKHNPNNPPFSNDDAAWRALHKARTGVKTLPLEARLLSYNWLKERGSSSFDDGELALASQGVQGNA